MITKTKPPLFFPGTRIGPYALVREIGKGTFGVVWLAERRGRLGTTRVALKSPVGLSESDRAFLSRESDVWIRSSGHPNVMPLLEAEEYDGCTVIVTEYAQEGSLETWLEKHGNRAPTLEAAVTLTAGILTGMAYLHARGVIHRDLKPANILLQGGIPRIADFGLARITGSAKHSYSIAGTPEYMAPEAWHGNRSAQTDIWSVGAMFYEMLTGRSPFPTDSWDVLRRAVEHCEPDPLPRTLPLHIQAAVLTALHKNPQDRFRSADDMLAELCDSATPASRVGTDTITSSVGSIHDALRDLDTIVYALENFTPQADSYSYIGHILLKCASFIEDREDRGLAEPLVEDLIAEVDALERRQERTVSIAKVRDLLRYFKRIKREYLQQAQHRASTANFG